MIMQKAFSFYGVHSNVWSDTDHTGIQLKVTETYESSGIFENNVFFTTIDKSGSVTLLVEDAVYAEHKLNINSSRIINESGIDQLNKKQLSEDIIGDECRHDMYGNIYCDLPQYDKLQMILSNPYTFLFVIVLSLIIGIIVWAILWKKRK